LNRDIEILIADVCVSREVEPVQIALLGRFGARGRHKRYDQHGDAVTRREARHLFRRRDDDARAGRGLDLEQPETAVAIDDCIEATIRCLLLMRTDVRLVEQVFENGRTSCLRSSIDDDATPGS
jgi:hypothetical protein